MATTADFLGMGLPTSWMSAPKPLQPGDYGYGAGVDGSGRTNIPLPPMSEWATPEMMSAQNGLPAGGIAPASTGTYANFAAQLEALRNGVPSAEVFAGGAAGMPTAQTLGGGSLGSNLGDMYAQWGVDQNANPFQGQLDKAFPDGTSPFLTYDQQIANTRKLGSTGVRGNTHFVRDPATGQMVPAPGTYGGGSVPGSYGGGAPALSAPTLGAPTLGGASNGSGYGMGSNPFQGAQADAIRQQSQDLFGNLNNQITSSAVGVGGLGGSRQGVAQGVAQGQAQNYLQSNLANLYGQNWQADQNRALQQYLGDQGFYTAQRGLDQSGAALGANLYSQGTLGQWGPISQAGAAYSPYTGFGNSTTNINGGGGAMGAFGGALGAAQLGKNFGWWG